MRTSTTSLPHSQRGVAIITVMLMVTLATIAVTAMVTQQRLDIHRAGNQQAYIQAHKLALAGERFAVQQLHLDRRNQKRSNSDSFEDRWATPTPPLPVEGGTIAGCIVDLQGRFNLNSLVADDGKLNNDQFEQFRRLLDVLDIDPVKAAAIIDWIDPDANIINADGAEDDYYSLRTPPYLAANRRISNLSELKLIRGFNEADDAEDYQLLLPHVSALPAVTAVNINTATAAVIESLDPLVDTGEAESLTRWEDESWKDYPECAEAPLPDDTGVTTQSTSREIYEDKSTFIDELNADRKEDEDPFENEDLITVESNYFEVRVNVELGPISTPQLSLLYRNDDGVVSVLQRARGDNLLQLVGN